jgi:PAS domain S-box-containing protein
MGQQSPREKSKAGRGAAVETREGSRIGVLCTDATGCIVDADAQMLAILGYELGELTAKHFDDIVHPDDRHPNLRTLSNAAAGKTTGGTYEKRFITATGAEVMTAVRASDVGVGDSTTGTIVMVADLTGEREALRALDDHQALLAQLISSAPMILFTYDRAGIVTLCEVHDPKASITHDDMLGHEIWKFTGDQPAADAHLREALQGESGEVELELAGTRFNCQYRPIRNAATEVIGVSAVALDLSELLSASAENQRQSDFLATMSHELRTPLNVILGFTQLLVAGMAGELNARQLRYVGNINSGGQQLLSLVNDILDLAKVRAGQMSLAVDQLDCRSVLHVVAVQAAIMAQAKQIEIVERPGSATAFSADGRRVHQILLNLLSNAITFSDAGGTIELEGRLQDGEVHLVVSDSGTGIAADQLQVIFEEYRQANDDRGSAAGTGLGLSLSRKLADIMGGTLTATSEEGVGSRFVLALPVAQPAA